MKGFEWLDIIKVGLLLLNITLCKGQLPGSKFYMCKISVCFPLLSLPSLPSLATPCPFNYPSFPPPCCPVSSFHYSFLLCDVTDAQTFKVHRLDQCWQFMIRTYLVVHTRFLYWKNTLTRCLFFTYKKLFIQWMNEWMNGWKIGQGYAG